MKRKKGPFIVLFLFFILLCANLSFGQKGFLMTERKVVEKYRLADAKFQKGKGYFIKGKDDKAEKEFRACLEIMPGHADALFFLSQIDYKKGDFNQALADIEKAKENYQHIGEFFTFTHQQRLETLRDEKMKMENEILTLQGQLAMAKTEEDKQKIQASINNVRALMMTIDTRLNEPLPDVLKTPADYYYFHGNILFKLNKFQEANDQYLEAIRIEPTHASAYNNLINLYFMGKNYEIALQFINQAEANGVKLNQKLKEAVLKAAGK
jgi:pentatricopeptide repeat protein